jgi:hypothetical protein
VKSWVGIHSPKQEISKLGTKFKNSKFTVKKMSANMESSEDFVFKFKTKTEEVNCDDDFMYIADETGLYWKALLQKTLASRWETNTPSHEMCKDCVTVLTCTTSSGYHKLLLLMIGK